MPASIPKNEQERLVALRRYDILDTQAEQAYDDITRLATIITQTPMAQISFVDAERQWFKSRVGVETTETPRDIAFCAHTILTPGKPFVVRDTTADVRFSSSPLVTEDPYIRFYAGEPLLTADHHALGALCVMDHTPRDLSSAQQDALAALSRLVVTQLELRRYAKELREASEMQAATLSALQEYQRQLETANVLLEEKSCTDKLTGIANRAGLDRRLIEEIERSTRHKTPLSLLLLDVDHFKQYNDTYGHLVGDEVLVQTAQAMQGICRAADFIGRFGGEEFAIILPATTMNEAVQIAERLRKGIASTPLPYCSITVSIGCATTSSTNTRNARQMLLEADKALYEAKGRGRNRVVHASNFESGN